MRISVALCTYNGAAYLREQLDSIAAQTLPPNELILSDDGSTDQTLQIAREFAATQPFPSTIIENPLNLGYSRNFNQAVQRCSHDMIALCDQDDIWYPEKLATLHQRLSQDEAIGGVFSNGDLIDSRSHVLGRTLWQGFRFNARDQASFNTGGAIDVLLRRNVVTGMAFAFRSSMKPMLRSVPPSWIHDGWLALQIARQSRLVAEPARLVGYRVHGAQQVGAPTSLAGKADAIRRNGISAFIHAVRARNLDEYQRTQLQYEDLLESLRQEDGLTGKDDLRTTEQTEALIAKAQAKAAYARRGASALGMPRHQRWPLLMSHLGSYLRFSPTGLRGLLRDLSV